MVDRNKESDGEGRLACADFVLKELVHCVLPEVSELAQVQLGLDDSVEVPAYCHDAWVLLEIFAQ